MDAIRAATAVPARVMGLTYDSGTIAPASRRLHRRRRQSARAIADIRKVTMVSAGAASDGAALKLGGFSRRSPIPIPDPRSRPPIPIV